MSGATDLRAAIDQGDPHAAGRLLPLVYYGQLKCLRRKSTMPWMWIVY
jgi:hypothetical protein